MIYIVKLKDSKNYDSSICDFVSLDFEKTLDFIMENKKSFELLELWETEKIVLNYGYGCGDFNSYHEFTKEELKNDIKLKNSLIKD